PAGGEQHATPARRRHNPEINPPDPQGGLQNTQASPPPPKREGENTATTPASTTARGSARNRWAASSLLTPTASGPRHSVAAMASTKMRPSATPTAAMRRLLAPSVPSRANPFPTRIAIPREISSRYFSG